jgi:hypothetical protein
MDHELAIEEAHRAGFLRRGLRRGYRVTLKGTRYLRDACSRHGDVRFEMSKHAEKWESGTMTKPERREALVELVAVAWEKDVVAEAEALAELRAQGFDPFAQRKK